MKIVIILGLILITSCDSITIDYRVGKCMSHDWFYKDIYKIEKTEGTKVFMTNLKKNKELIISKMDKGWKEVGCI